MGNVNAIRGVRRLLAAVLPAGLVAACASPPSPFPELPRLDISTKLTSRNVCGLGVSPPISIGKAPPATAQYRLRMTNIDVLFQQPWQTTVDAKPGGFAEGAIADYQAPCVGDLRVYSFYRFQQYRLEVLALDAQSRPLAYGSTNFLLQSISSMQDRERSPQARRTPEVPVARPSDVVGRTMGPVGPNTIGPQLDPTLMPQIFGPIDQQ
jgi:hypothetical protein